MDPLSRAFERYRRHGDARALGTVFDALAPRLLSLALHLSPRPADAEDLLQETFVRAMLAAHQFDCARPLEPWLCGLMANAAQNLRRREARRSHADLADVDDRAVAAGPAAQAERSELVGVLRMHINALPNEQRQALLLQLQHGLSPAEIAEVLAVPAGTIRMRLLRGLRALRRLLPAGLAALFGLGTESRGLAAVRATVMRRATAVPTSIGAAVLLGAAAWQYIVAVGALLLLVVGAVIALRPALRMGLPEQVPAAAATASPASARQADTSRAGTLDDRVGEAARREVAAPTAVRRVSVHVTQRLRGEPDATAFPLPGAAVTVYHSGDRDRTTRVADTTGDVTFAELAPGRWRVKVDCDVSLDSVTRDVDVTAADAAVQVALEFPSRLQGIVIDSDGLPVADAEIWSGFCLPGVVSPLAAIGRQCAVTRPDGGFSVLVGGMMGAVSARKDGHAASWSVPPVMRSATQDQVRLVLGASPAAVHGVVLGANGGPAAGATVALALQAGGNGFSVRAADGSEVRTPVPVVVTTDRLGTFTVRGLRPGTYTCWAEVKGGILSRSFEATAFATAEVCVDAGARATLRGIVRDRDGAPLAGANVVVLAGDGREVRWDTTGPDGTFGVLSVPAGPLRVQTRRGARVAAEVSVTPGPGESVHCELATDEHPVVGGVLVGEDGVAIGGWCVRAEVGAEVSEVLTSPDGTFVCFGSGAGPLQLRVMCRVGSDEVVLSREDVPAGSLDLRLQVPAAKLPEGVLTGRVVDETGASLPGVTAVLDRPRQLDLVMQTEADGRFTFQRLVAGDYELTLRAPRRVARSVQVAVRADEPCELDAVRLEPAGILRVRVARGDGGKWTGRPPTPRVLRADGSEWSPYPVPIFDGDIVEFDSLPSGRYVLQGVTVFAAPLAVELQAGRTTSVDWPTRPGHVRALRFHARPDATADDTLRVTLRDHTGLELALLDAPRWFEGEDGRGWMLPVVLPEGSFAVEARAAGCRYALQLHVGGELEAQDVTVPAAR
jgi:RNA polymerase sigma-70 factor (ECF subfamily)